MKDGYLTARCYIHMRSIGAFLVSCGQTDPPTPQHMHIRHECRDFESSRNSAIPHCPLTQSRKLLHNLWLGARFRQSARVIQQHSSQISWTTYTSPNPPPILFSTSPNPQFKTQQSPSDVHPILDHQNTSLRKTCVCGPCGTKPELDQIFNLESYILPCFETRTHDKHEKADLSQN
jgi:hypothetical protein